MTVRYGAHISLDSRDAVWLHKAIAEGQTAAQVFIANARAYNQFVEWSQEAIDAIKETDGEFELFAHAPLSMTMTKSDPLAKYSAKMLQKHLRIMDMLGGKGVITHVGSTKPVLPADSYRRRLGHEFYDRMRAALASIASVSSKCILYLENVASNGSLASGLDFLREMVEPYQDTPTKIMICYDTAHAYSAGCLIPPDSDLWDYIGVLHFNSPLEGLVQGCNKDRHAWTLDTEEMKAVLATLPARAWRLPLIVEKTDDIIRDIELIKRWGEQYAK